MSLPRHENLRLLFNEVEILHAGLEICEKCSLRHHLEPDGSPFSISVLINDNRLVQPRDEHPGCKILVDLGLGLSVTLKPLSIIVSIKN